MNVGASGEPSVIAALAIATAVDPAATALVGRRPADEADDPALHALRAATILTARRGKSGVVVQIRSRTVDDLPEDDLLSVLDADLQSLTRDGASLVTFGDRTPVIGFLRRRLARHMMFGLAGAAGWAAGDALHVDLARTTTLLGSPSLRRGAAALGIAAPSSRTAVAPSGGCEIECATLYLIYLHELAASLRLAGPLLDGWRALAAAIDHEPARLAYLASLRKPAGLATAL